MGIDFCCGGKKTLEEACEEQGLDVLRVREELNEAQNMPFTGPQHDFDSWNLGFLADYIINVHHNYVRKQAPVLAELSDKVAGHHGPQNPVFIDIRNKTHELLRELLTHLKKEEQILFPYIKDLEAKGLSQAARPGFDTVKNPIWMMEAEHDHAGELGRDIRKLTNNYTLPANACNSVSLLYHMLEAFESDLFNHIHLENNILFPTAISMEQG
jgi:regulator of cell morphogenesis and NO signaling